MMTGMDVNGSTWEERMSQRAKVRAAIAEAEQIAVDAAEGRDDESEDGWATVIPGTPEGGRPTVQRYVVRDGRLERLPDE